MLILGEITIESILRSVRVEIIGIEVSISIQGDILIIDTAKEHMVRIYNIGLDGSRVINFQPATKKTIKVLLQRFFVLNRSSDGIAIKDNHVAKESVVIHHLIDGRLGIICIFICSPEFGRDIVVCILGQIGGLGDLSKDGSVAQKDYYYCNDDIANSMLFLGLGGSGATAGSVVLGLVSCV